MDIVTIKELAVVLNDAVKKGLGDKKILLSDDDEGNGYHGCFFHLSSTDKTFTGDSYDPYVHLNVTLEELRNDFIILG